MRTLQVPLYLHRLQSEKTKRKKKARLKQNLFKCVDHVKNHSVESSLNIFRQHPQLSPKRPFKIRLSSAERERAIALDSASPKFFTVGGQESGHNPVCTVWSSKGTKFVLKHNMEGFKETQNDEKTMEKRKGKIEKKRKGSSKEDVALTQLLA